MGMSNQHTNPLSEKPPCKTEEGKFWRQRYLNQLRINRETSALNTKIKNDLKGTMVRHKENIQVKKKVVAENQELKKRLKKLETKLSNIKRWVNK